MNCLWTVVSIHFDMFYLVPNSFRYWIRLSMSVCVWDNDIASAPIFGPSLGNIDYTSCDATMMIMLKLWPLLNTMIYWSCSEHDHFRTDSNTVDATQKMHLNNFSFLWITHRHFFGCASMISETDSPMRCVEVAMKMFQSRFDSSLAGPGLRAHFIIIIVQAI